MSTHTNSPLSVAIASGAHVLKGTANDYDPLLELIGDARIVNKQRSQYGETKEEQEKDKRGESPDRGLPIENYQTLTIAEVRRELDSLSRQDVKKIRTYETKHKNRKGLLQLLDARLK